VAVLVVVMHTILGAADALGEPLAALLGDLAYYRRFGFALGTVYQITPPKAAMAAARPGSRPERVPVPAGTRR
jgi:predicted N-acetyltransferase YhbS